MNWIVLNPWRRGGGWTHRAMLLAGALIVGAVMALSAACGDGGDGNEDGAAASPTSAATAVPAITIEGAWARKAPMMAGGAGGMMAPGNGGMTSTAVPGERGAAYMIIRNGGDIDDALIGASSDVATATEVHESKMDGDTVTMQQVDRIGVPARGSVELKPGGYHVMFIGLTRQLNAGETIEVTLHFERAGDVVVQATVRDA